ncbi:MAG TPA: hypothetical protein VD902_07850 [Symbiobacteriaceae bacterium]|nr:hypothetical protein [Symbiobacteriaceae bacterium]
MARQSKSEETVREAGMYVCGDGCERRYYREGERFLHCAVENGRTTWTKIEEL